ncbi:DUF5711 family protein [Chakrabartyella piscis]|uniref:DUF5711 family protein n=1 Tax=Chakrabartyella piscis TaxID=2918914 RepID=UPI0029586319|nr:DUF5711 family protein [Chakrabartyella piscis]
MARKKDKEKRTKKKPNVQFWGIICLSALFAMAGVYLETMYGEGVVRDFVMDVVPVESESSTGVVAENTITIGENTSTQIIPFGESFLLSTKDGVKYYDSIGDQKWSDTFNMENPKTIYEGEYVAVADMNGRGIRVYNQVGLQYTLQLDGAPIQFELNTNGYLSVIFKSQDEYYVRVYNQNGVLLKGRVEAADGTYPMFSDVSDDNKTFCVTYLDTNDIKMKSKVLFFYLNPGDSEAYTDSMFAGIEMEDEVVSKVKYMDNNTLFAISDQQLLCITTAGVESWNMEFSNWVELCDFSNKSYAVLVLGAVLPNAEGVETGTILSMDTKGKEVGTYQMDGVEYLRASDKGIVVGDGKTYVGLTYKGSEEWQHQVTGGIKDVLTMSSLNRVLMVGALQAELFTLRGTVTQTNTLIELEETEPEVVKMEEVESEPEETELELEEVAKEVELEP